MNNAHNNAHHNQHSNSHNYNDAGVATPVFRVLADGSITPTIGTAGTFTRSGSILIGSQSKSTLTSKGTNVAAAEAYPTGATSPSTTRGGVLITSDVTNYILQASAFATTWTNVGTGGVSSNATSDPEGGGTADRISGTSAGAGVTQTSTGNAAASTYWSASVWLKADSGSRTVSLIVKDGGSESATTSCTVTTSWQQFTVSKNFSGAASGNVIVQILVGDTTGFNIYAYGAGLFKVSDGTTAGWHYPTSDFFPTIITTTTALSLTAAFLKYEGTELQTSTQKLTTVLWWYQPQDSFPYQNKYLFQQEDNAFAIFQSAYYSASTATVWVSYYNGTMVDTGDQPVYNRWNQLIVTSNGATGSNETFLNGVSVHTDSNTFAALSVKKLMLGTKWSDGTSQNLRLNSILGRNEFYLSRASTAQAAALYSAQKGDYGL